MSLLCVLFSGVMVFCCSATGEDGQPAAKTVEERFPDYRPKTSADTVLDYRPQISARLEKLPEASLGNLPGLIGLLEDYRKKSRRNPGKTEEGNVILGADPQEYVPSDEELIQSEIGERIRKVVQAASPAALKKAKLTARQVEYGAITYRHVDVMGSGRFFYASSPTKTIISLVK
jgi:hypothetical protein